MRDEDIGELGQAHGADELALGSLAAVEEHAVAAASDQQRGQATARGRGGAGGAGEEHGQVHRCSGERSVAAALTVVLALLLLVLPAPAGAAPRAGVVVDLPLTDGDYARLRESGVKVVRLFMFTPD